MTLIRYIGPVSDWDKNPIEVFKGTARRLVANGNWEYVQ